MILWTAASLAVGCGRIHFGAVDTRSDAGPRDAGSDADVTDAGGDPDAGVPTTLVHWYRFEGTGTIATDSVGSAHGEVMGSGSLSGTGTLSLAGGTSEQYVNLPNGVLSALPDATIESWVVWNGSAGGDYQRIFDFGNSSGGEGVQAEGTRHFSLAVTPSGQLRLVFDVDPSLDSTGWRVFWVDALPTGSLHQVVATFDSGPSPNVIAVYLDGALLGMTTVPDTESLADIDDVNGWLGRAQWSADAEFEGTLHDVRIYDVAMSEAEIAERYARGPDVP